MNSLTLPVEYVEKRYSPFFIELRLHYLQLPNARLLCLTPLRRLKTKFTRIGAGGLSKPNEPLFFGQLANELYFTS